MSKLRRLASVLVVVMLVAQASVAPVAAASTSDSDSGDSVECYARSAVGVWEGIFGADWVDQCEAPNEDAGEQHADVYASALEAQSRSDHVTTTTSNQLEASRQLCWCKLKAKAIKELENGSTKAQALKAVNATIDKHYARIQYNYLSAWNTSVHSAAYSAESAHQDGLHAYYGSGKQVYIMDLPSATTNVDEVFSPTKNMSTSLGATWTATQDVTNSTVTLVDGSNRSVTVLADTYDNLRMHPWVQGSSDPSQKLTLTKPSYGRLDVSANKGVTAESVVVINETTWENGWTKIKSEHDYMRTQAKKYVDGLYSSYDPGSDHFDVDTTELQSACSMSVYQTDTNSTGYYGHARAQLALMGYNGSVNSSFTIDYSPAVGNEYAGDVKLGTSVGGYTVKKMSLGDGAIITDTPQRVRVTLSSSSVSPTLTLTGNQSGATKTLNMTNRDGNTEYSATLSNMSAFTAGEDITVEMSVGSDTAAIATWTWSPNGNASVTLTGGLYTDWKPSATNGTFVTGTTYDTSSTSKPVYFAANTEDGMVMKEIDGTFTLSSMTNVKTGESVNETSLEDYNTQTYNSSLTMEQLTKLLDWRDTHSQNYGVAGGSLGGFNLGGIGTPMLIGLAAAIYLLFGRGDNPL